MPVTLRDGTIVGNECPGPGPGAEEEMAAQAVATPIPIVVGLTLSHIWKANQTDEYECLTQVTAIDAASITVSNSCGENAPGGAIVRARRICRADLRDARIYHTQFSSLLPEVLTGTTTFSWSAGAFADLKSRGEMRHRYLQINARQKPSRTLYVRRDLDGTLKKRDTSVHVAWALDLSNTADVIVNDRKVPLPVIHAWGNLEGADGMEAVRSVVLDEAAFPLVLRYELVGQHFFIEYTKISFPTRGLEHALETDRHVDVYGIYFDFGSDHLRPESEPVLREVADALKKNADWKLSIHGHTDNIGGDTLNMDLSTRRSEAVRQALVTRFAIDAARLTTAGHGASQPKESNDTPEGRARNRRVELVRE